MESDGAGLEVKAHGTLKGPAEVDLKPSAFKTQLAKLNVCGLYPGKDLSHGAFVLSYVFQRPFTVIHQK